MWWYNSIVIAFAKKYSAMVIKVENGDDHPSTTLSTSRLKHIGFIIQLYIISVFLYYIPDLNLKTTTLDFCEMGFKHISWHKKF